MITLTSYLLLPAQRDQRKDSASVESLLDTLLMQWTTAKL